MRNSIFFSFPQEITNKIEQNKEIIDQNNKTFFDMKKKKDQSQNERKLVDLVFFKFFIY